MEKKKNENLKSEKLRFPIILMATLFVSSLILASFSYTSVSLRDMKTLKSDTAVDISYVLEDKKVQPKIDLPKIKIVLPPSVRIKIDSNTQILPDPVIILPMPPDVDGDTVDIIPPAPIIDFPDVEAGFPGGAAAMQKWISENVTYPETSIELEEEGKVYLSFIIETDGSISKVNVERGVSKDLNKEAKRVAKKMPNWVPAEVKGKKVRTRCRLPIIFELN